MNNVLLGINIRRGNLLTQHINHQAVDLRNMTQMSTMARLGVIVFDMDDTLVDRESVYTAAQSQMLKALQRLAAKSAQIPLSISELRKVDLKLIELHKGDHMYDYVELARALWLHFVSHMDQREAAEQAYRENLGTKITFGPAITAARLHDRVLRNKMPRMLSSARHVLRKLKRRYFLVLFPSGDEKFQKRVIRYHCFDTFFDYVFVRRVKDLSTFKELKRLAIKLFERELCRTPQRLVMVGDRISQDITPASDAGFETVWIPGPYFPGNSLNGRPTHTIRKLRDLLRILPI